MMRTALTYLLLALTAHTSESRRHANLTDEGVTDWVIFAHGSTRMRAKGTGQDWTATFDMEGEFHFPIFAVPFAEGPDRAAGVNHRTEDNHIHIPMLGDHPYGGSPEWPAGGSKRQYSPPYVWEVDGNTGKTIRTYDLSKYAGCFDSVLRYTPDGYPLIAAYGGRTGQGSTPILLLDKESDKVLQVIPDNQVEPSLLQITNTEPQQMIWASINADAGVSLSGHSVVSSSYVSTSETSTIIFGADGRTIYNNGFFNHATGIFKFALPLQSHLKEELFIQGCNTRPWVFASDTKERIYALCGSDTVYAYDKSGRREWTFNGSPVWLIMNDEETVVIVGGGGGGISGLSADSGQTLWSLQPSDISSTARIQWSNQPWAPRHPIPLADNGLAILVLEENVHRVVVFDASTGKQRHQQSAMFDFYPEMLTADANNNLYAFGHDSDGKVTIQRKSLGTK